MHLLFNQLIYTSLPRTGFKLLASKQVPAEIQQIFIDRVVFQHWDAYQQVSDRYQAVYLHQVSPEHSLFGWLYNDGVDDLGRGPVPYFICYYLTEPLSDLLLEVIFTFLDEGPVVLADRQSLSAPLETILLQDLWHYQSVRPGVAIPLDVRKQYHFALKQGELLDLFIPVDEQEMVIEFKEQVRPQKLAATQNNAEPNSLQSYRKSLLLLGISFGTVTSSLALIISYQVLQITNLMKSTQLPEASSGRTLTQSHPRLISSEISLVFYRTLAEVPNIPQGVFDYGVSSVSTPPVWSKTIISAIEQAQPQFRLRYMEPIGSDDTSTGIELLLSGELSFFQSARPIKNSEFLEAKERGFTLEQIPVAIDSVAFYVNHQVSIPGLNLTQLRDIFTGKITNWKAVGGPDLKITPFSLNSQIDDTVTFLEENLFAGEALGPTVQKVATTAESIQKVAQTPGGISFAPTSQLVGQTMVYPLSLSRETSQAFVAPDIGVNSTIVNKSTYVNASYPLTRRVFVIVKRDRTADEQAGNAYASLLLTDEGQQLLSQVGLVPIR